MQLIKSSRREAEKPMLMRLRDDMNRIFDRFVHEPWAFPWINGNGADWVPAVDIIDGEREITVRAEIPGVLPKDVDVSISGNLLTISGKKEEYSKVEEKDYFLSERTFGSFRRTITLPEGIDPDRVTATHENGVLTIKIARLKEATPKHIPVKAGTNT